MKTYDIFKYLNSNKQYVKLNITCYFKKRFILKSCMDYGDPCGDSALAHMAEVSLSRCIWWHLFETQLPFSHVPPECGRP